MSAFGKIPRWATAALVTGAVGVGMAGCVAVPVGGYGYGPPEPAVVFPSPGVVIAPPPVIYRDRSPRWRGPRYGDRWHRHAPPAHRGRNHGGWNGRGGGHHRFQGG